MAAPRGCFLNPLLSPFRFYLVKIGVAREPLLYRPPSPSFPSRRFSLNIPGEEAATLSFCFVQAGGRFSDAVQAVAPFLFSKKVRAAIQPFGARTAQDFFSYACRVFFCLLLDDLSAPSSPPPAPPPFPAFVPSPSHLFTVPLPLCAAIALFPPRCCC